MNPLTTLPQRRTRLSEVAQPIARPEAKRHGTFWLGLAAIWIFTATFLQFGLIDHYAAPAETRVNNGTEATFFAVHMSPYYVFSEDFHLYVVRSKRLLDRGWTDFPLCHAENENHRPSAPVQAGLMMLAAQTGGRPWAYSFFMAGVLSVSWGLLYLAAVRWAPFNQVPLTMALAVLVTVLFESLKFVADPENDFGQSPLHRGLRMATLAWANPLALAMLLAAVSLLFRRERPWGRLSFVMLALATLAAGDTWSFLLAAGNVGLLLGLAGLTAIVARRRLAGGAWPMWRVSLGLACGLVCALLIYRATNTGFSGDVLSRAGFGEAWHSGLNTIRDSGQYAVQTRFAIRAILLLTAIVAISARLLPGQTLRSLRMNISWDWPPMPWLHAFCLAVVPIAACLILTGLFIPIGMDSYHAEQFIWRRDFAVLFAVTLMTLVGARWVMHELTDDRRRQLSLELAATAVGLCALLGYHTFQVHRFVRNVAGREFFLTEDQEYLRDWLADNAPPQGNYTLATASHELNLLCAYWTDADLLLPAGFPYHGTWSNDEIESQMAQLLAIYGATPERWMEFNLFRHGRDQTSWALSRLTSARQGYMYYLLHRADMIRVAMPSAPKSLAPKRTAAYWAQWFIEEEARNATKYSPDSLLGKKIAIEIADRLDQLPPVPVDEQPDVIVIDEVSRFLGTPDLTNYTQEFEHGQIEAWVKKPEFRTARLSR